MRWSNCYICKVEEGTVIDKRLVCIFECSKCHEEYCDECGDLEKPYICNNCKGLVKS